MLISHRDPRLSWPGAISLEQTEAYTRPWRLPFARRALFENDLVLRARTQAGVRLTFVSDTRTLAGQIIEFEANQKLDLYLDRSFFASVSLAGEDRFEFSDLPEGEKLIELWLPQRGDFALEELEIDDGATLTEAIDERPRWITYGSSITHCGEAESPSQTWPAIVARALGVNHTNLGYGGQCHLDPLLAMTIRDQPADFISLAVGINVYGHNSFNARSFPSSLIGFVEIIREKQPTTPIALISPIYSFERETTPNAVGWTLRDYRASVQDVAARLREAGDSELSYIDGLDLYDASLGHLMPDQLHPNAEGYKALGARFLLHGAPTLFGSAIPNVEGSQIRAVEGLA